MQVLLFLTWVQYLKDLGWGPDQAIWINMDESSIPYHIGGRKGNKIGTNTKHLAQHMKEPTSLSMMRRNCTLMAALTTNKDFQQHVPQVILPNVIGQKRDGTQPAQRSAKTKPTTFA